MVDSLPRNFWLTPREELKGLTCREWLKVTGFGPNGKFTRYGWLPNPDLARELTQLLGVKITPRKIKEQAQVVGLTKAAETIAKMREAQAAAQRKPPKPPRSPKYNQPLKLMGDAIIASCWHVPYWSRKFAQYLMDIAKGFGIKQLVIPGDFLNLGAFAKYYPNTKEVTTVQEFTSANELLKWLTTWFTKIYICRGNHEDRLWTRLLDREVPFEDVGALCGGSFNGRVIWTPYAYMLLKSGQETWRVTHPGSYSRIPTRVAQTLAQKYQQHICSAHGHLMGWSPSLSAQFNSVDSGGMFDISKIDYIGLEDTTYLRWIEGFVVIRNGKPYIFNELFCDFDWWYETLDIQAKLATEELAFQAAKLDAETLNNQEEQKDEESEESIEANKH